MIHGRTTEEEMHTVEEKTSGDIPAFILIIFLFAISSCKIHNLKQSRPEPVKLTSNKSAKPKKRLTEIKPGKGLITKIDSSQIGIIYDESDEFSPIARINRSFKKCSIEVKFTTTTPAESNFDYLMGGIKKPDPFLVSERKGSKVTAYPYPVKQSTLKKIEHLFSGVGKASKKTCNEIESIIETDKNFPLLHYIAAGCYQEIGDRKKTIQHLKSELEINPSHAQSHLALADIYADGGRNKDAIEEVAMAILYYPGWRNIYEFLKLKKELNCIRRGDIFKPEISIRISKDGTSIAVGYPPDKKWMKAYGFCKAAFRYCPEVRMAFGMKSGPYKLSVVEEMACLSVAASEYKEQRSKSADREGEFLLSLKQSSFIQEFALLEIIGKYNPDYLKFLPEEIRNSILEFIKRFILKKTDGGMCNPKENHHEEEK